MRINRVNKARKAQRDCEKCHKPIGVGDSYQWVKSRYGPKRVRHSTCPSWRQSELTSSKLATAYAAQEAAHDALDALDALGYISIADDGEPEFDADGFVSEVREIVGECESAAEECGYEYQEGIDNMPENLQYGDVAEAMREKVDALESWGSECSMFDPSASFDPDSHLADVGFWGDEGVDQERYRSEYEGAVEDFAQEVIDEARDMVDSLEV